jgi:hypothetical protein
LIAKAGLSTKSRMAEVADENWLESALKDDSVLDLAANS